MIKLSATYEDGVLCLKKNNYIEDGWYIEYVGGNWTLYEIPQHGGQPQYIDQFSSFDAVYERAISLT